MSSVVNLASQLTDGDLLRASILFTLIGKISDHPQDPLKAAYRTEVLKWLLTQSPKFESLFEAELTEAEKLDEDRPVELAAGASH